MHSLFQRHLNNTHWSFLCICETPNISAFLWEFLFASSSSSCYHLFGQGRLTGSHHMDLPHGPWRWWCWWWTHEWAIRKDGWQETFHGWGWENDRWLPLLWQQLLHCPLHLPKGTSNDIIYLRGHQIISLLTHDNTTNNVHGNSVHTQTQQFLTS